MRVLAQTIAGASKLKVIGRAGAGVDTIDVDAVPECRIAVMSARDGNTHAAAEHSMISLLGSASGRVTPVNALHEAAARGLSVSETVGGDSDRFDRLLRVRVGGDDTSGKTIGFEIEATS